MLLRALFSTSSGSLVNRPIALVYEVWFLRVVRELGAELLGPQGSIAAFDLAPENIERVNMFAHELAVPVTAQNDIRQST
jgi:hypothetical protein